MRVKIIIFLLVVNGVYESHNQMDCGTHKTVRSIIIGGDETVRGEHPWKAVLIKKNGIFFCGGNLISSRAVLTAAHCIKGKFRSHDYSPEDFTVWLGSHDISNTIESGRVAVSVKSIQVHPDWNVDVESFDGDIALLIFETEVQFTSLIQPICLAKPQSPVAQATEGIVIGYGKTESATYSNIAKKLKAPIKSFHTCVNEYQILRPFLTARTFCGGPGDGKGVCEGDSGSGLYVLHNNRFYLRGTTSASAANNVNECDVNTFAIFVDTTEYCGWIRSGGLNKYAQCSENDDQLIPASPFGFGGYSTGLGSYGPASQFDFIMGQGGYRSGQGRYTPSTQDDYRTGQGSYGPGSQNYFGPYSGRIPGSQFDFITGQGGYRSGQGRYTPTSQDDYSTSLGSNRAGSLNDFITGQGGYIPGQRRYTPTSQDNYRTGLGSNRGSQDDYRPSPQYDYRTGQGNNRPGGQNYFGTNQRNYRSSSQDDFLASLGSYRPGQGRYIPSAQYNYRTRQGSYRPRSQNYFGTYQRNYRPDSQDDYISDEDTEDDYC